MVRLEINFPRVLFGHNAASLGGPSDLVDVLTEVKERVSQILADPSDSMRIIPGLSDSSSAFWGSLELQILLPDQAPGFISLFSSARHSRIPKPTRVCKDESVTMGERNGRLVISIYDKTKEVKRGKLRKLIDVDESHWIRFEARAGAISLAREFAELRDEKVEDAPMVRSFRFAELRSVHRSIMAGIVGIGSVPLRVPGGNPTGLLLGDIAADFGHPLGDLLEIYVRRKQPCENTFLAVRKAALEVVASKSPITLESVFAPETYEMQSLFGIKAEALSAATQSAWTSRGGDPEIQAIYGDPESRFKSLNSNRRHYGFR